ncbi:tubulin-specific chaperone D [Schistocerca piceifrons]|uniref:tubulin-specific chaperone D n=1 Tax=Schistocerca piceifrons TaxID=274613 RepID=UPI001F5F4D25|nr:tubulin-specific chaperone D [Schistocerca piceifrons]XP_049946067.1 tubulin-specific chaperone D [Schistocerca serialis cubense]
MEVMNVEDESENIGLGCALELFSEVDEVMDIFDKLQNNFSEIVQEQQYERFRYVLSLYQEQPHLLDPHLDRMLEKLVNIIRKDDNPMDLKHETFKYLHVITSVRGYKFVVRRLPHEVSDVEPVLHMLECQDPSDTETWQTRYMLILWLSIIVMIPFHMSRLDSFASGEGTRKTVMERILEICKIHAVKDLFRVSAFLTSHFLTRVDVKDLYLVPFFDWARNIIADGNSPVAAKCGCLAAIAAILKHGKREDLLPHAPDLLRFLLGINYRNDSEIVRRYAIKIMQRIGLTFLKPRVAKWRYNRGSRSLAANLSVTRTTASGDIGGRTANGAPATIPVMPQHQQPVVAAPEDDDDDVEVPEEVEEVIEELMQGLRDINTQIRWSAAKGIGRVTGRLPRDLADEVLCSVLELFSPRELHSAWHGGCLALAELGRRGLLLPARLPTVVPVVLKALTYDEPCGSSSVGIHIRDAACYVCWSFARAYDRDVLAPFVKDIAATLLVVASFDREINCRKAASAAFQENVGRQGTFPHGIDILTTADFFAVSSRTNAYLNISVYIAQFEEYTLPLINHLVERKVDHWDIAIQDLAAKALHNLTPRAPEYTATAVMDKLLTQTLSIDMKARHGAVLAIGEIVHALSLLPGEKKIEDHLGSERVEKIRGLVPQFEQKFYFRGMGGELMKQACSHLIQRCSMAHLPFHGTSTIEEWQALLDQCLPSEVEVIRSRACSALPAFFTEYYQGPANAAKRDAVVNHYMKQLNAYEQTVRLGFASAVGSFPKLMLNGKVADVLTALVHCCHITDSTLKWSESRRDAINAITAVVKTVGVQGVMQASRTLMEEVLECFLTGLSEYTLDSRGDIGAWVREAALSGLQVVVLLLAREMPEALRPDTVSRTMVGVVQHCLEKIERVRAHAGRVFTALLHSEYPVPSIPDCNELRRIFPAHDCTHVINWKCESETYPSFCQLLPLTPYTACVMEGLLTCMGGDIIILANRAGATLIAHLQQLRTTRDTQELTRLAAAAVLIWRENQYSERVAVPVMKALNQLLERGCFDVILKSEDGNEGSNLAKDLLELALAEANKAGRSAKRIGAIIPLLCQLIQVPGTVRKRALGRLARYICQPFVWARKLTASQLYEALLMYGDEMSEAPDVDGAMQLLSETSWNEAVEEIRPIRNKICNMLGIPALVPLSEVKPGTASSANLEGSSSKKS